MSSRAGYELIDESETLRRAILKTIDTFSGITGRKLVLKNCAQAKTDGISISIPFFSPWAYALTEHELAHVLFGSDAKEAALFVKSYVMALDELVYNQVGRNLSTSAVTDFLQFIIGLLDDHRVNELWGRIYAGSREQIRIYNLEEAHKISDEKAGTDLLPYFHRLSCGYDVPACPFNALDGLLCEALTLVEGRSFAAVLATTKWLVMQLIDYLVSNMAQKGSPEELDGGSEGQGVGSGEPTSAQRKVQAFEHLLQRAQANANPGLAGIVCDVVDGAGSSFVTEAVKAEVDELLDLARDEIEDFLDTRKEEITTALERVQEALSGSVSKDTWLRSSTDAKVLFRDVKKGHIGGKDLSQRELMEQSEELAVLIEDPKLSWKKKQEAVRDLEILKAVFEAQAQEGEAIRKLRAVFYRVIGRRRSRLEDSGTEVDFEAWLDTRISGVQRPCFHAPAMSRGFRCLILIDRSTSMKGLKTVQVDSACRILVQALQFPFVRLQVWGFSSLDNGQVDIVRYESGYRRFLTPVEEVHGATPLHIAVRLGLKELSDSQDHRSLFVLTDGKPFFGNKKAIAVPEQTMMTQVRGDVITSRRGGVHAYGVLVAGLDRAGQLAFAVTPEQMGFMFGPSHLWRRMLPPTLASELVQFVSAAFVRYLRAV